MPNTSKGFPYPAGSDNVDVPGDIQALADAVDLTPGIRSYTSTQIAGLAVGDKWAGRVVWNSTTSKLQVSNGSTFSDVDTSVALSSSTPQNLGTAAAGSSSDASRADHRHAMPSASDVGAVANSLVSGTKGAVPVGTGSTVAALSPGSNGQTLVADSSQTNGLRYIDGQTQKNVAYNGNFAVWQRGTSQALTTGMTYGCADRWAFMQDSSPAATASQVTTSLPTGFRYGLKLGRNSGNSGTGVIRTYQILETNDSLRLAGQVVTLSFWAKAGANYSRTSSLLSVRLATGTGTDQAVSNMPGGSLTNYAENISTNVTLTTSWQRFTLTSSTLSSSATQVGFGFFYTPSGTAGADDAFYITGVQVEASPVATPFEFEPYEATLRKCQRYYYLFVDGNDRRIGSGGYYNSTTFSTTVQFPTTMRTAPSLTATTGTSYYTIYVNNGTDPCDSVAISSASTNAASLDFTGNVSGTATQAGLINTNNASSSIAFAAEL